MLIDTNSIISKTELRQHLNLVLARVAAGEEIHISDRGKMLAKIILVDKSSNTTKLKSNRTSLKQSDELIKDFYGVWGGKAKRASEIEKELKRVAIPAKTKGKVDFSKFPAFGIWKDREDMKDVDAWVRQVREKNSKRYPF